MPVRRSQPLAPAIPDVCLAVAADENQSVIPGALTGYCAPGVVPRDEAGSCKVKPIVEKGPAIAKLKTALSSFDSLLKECS